MKRFAPYALRCALFSLVTILAACQSVPIAVPTPYREAGLTSDYGYSSVQLTENEYRVMYKATDLTDADKIQAYTLRRAAEIGLSQGFEWMTIVRTNVEKKAVIGKSLIRQKNSDTTMPPQQECTMSGCTEPDRLFINDGSDVKVENTPMHDVFYSVLVRFGQGTAEAEADVMTLQRVLAESSRVDAKPKGQ